MGSDFNSPSSFSSSLESSRVDLSSSDTDQDGVFEKALLLDGDDGNSQYVLVTGGLGYIGSHTCLELLKSGYNVLIVDDLSNSYYRIFDKILKASQEFHTCNQTALPKANLSIMDYGDVPAMRELFKEYVAGPVTAGITRRSRIIGVIHFAALKQVEESIRSPLKYYENNISAQLKLLKLLDEFNIRTYIFSSSASVYGSQAAAGQLLCEEDCLHEPEITSFPSATGERLVHRPPNPNFTAITNAYGRTKLFGEAILADLARSDPSWKVIALRYFNPIGGDASGLLGEEPRTPSTTLPAAISRVLTGATQNLNVYGDDWDSHDGTPIRDFIHVTDLARGHIAALAAASSSASWSSKEEGGSVKENFRTFNLGTGSGHSVFELVHTLEAVSRQAIPCRVVQRRPGDVMSSVANTERAARELGWKTEMTLVDACRDLCNYLEKGEKKKD
ncbi:hypothetical protein BJY01DRAFT_255240 [Aspergillus pseudoustus]|uniref:NAD-dependent epimerase/dehydratase domain-containing protein n=1 Tax=Aspergillus pseudoustus TaxID=1810923 RepID=A0ABR4IM11_9EURO